MSVGDNGKSEAYGEFTQPIRPISKARVPASYS